MRSLVLRASALALATALSTPASALLINFIDIGGVSGTPAQSGFAAAANYWQSVITTPVTVNIQIGYSNLGPGVLGSAWSTLYPVPITSVYSQLSSRSSSGLDALAVSNLEPLTSGALSMITPGYQTAPKLGINNNTRVFDNDGSYNNSVVVGSGANLRALGYAVPGDAADATIQFSSAFSFDFSPGNGITPGSYDFIGVAIHEIGHALGFLSGADDYDYYGCPNGPDCGTLGTSYPVNNDWWGYVGDLFRYSNDPTAVGPGGPQLDWAPGSPAYFSIDGGLTAFGGGFFSTGDYHGNGFQASHWMPPGNCGTFLGMMNPYVCNGLNVEVRGLDLAYFDAIGWNLSVDVLQYRDYAYSTQQIPEPATWALLMVGLGLVGATRRRRQ